MEKNTENNNIEEKEDNEYEDVCYLCRRTESTAGKMVHMPNNICVCSDCMQKTLDTMGNGNIDYGNMMKNMPNISFLNMSDLLNFGGKMDGPKAKKLKKKKPEEKSKPIIDIKDIPAPH